MISVGETCVLHTRTTVLRLPPPQSREILNVRDRDLALVLVLIRSPAQWRQIFSTATLNH